MKLDHAFLSPKEIPVKLHIPISKIDEEQRMVYGYASTEAMDLQGEQVSKDAIAAALPDYMKFANIREMHQPSAVGVAKQAQMDDKGLSIAVKVVDNSAWEKVKEGVYKGFSIGGRMVEKVGDMITNLTLSEISLVDRPANPEALITVWKAADVEPAPIDLIADLLNKALITPERLSDLAHAEVLSKSGTESGSDPVPAATLELTTVEKGMSHVAQLAYFLKELGYLVSDQTAEALREGDNSTIPAQLHDWLAQGATILNAMTAEETTELIADKNPETDETPALINWAERIGDIEKRVDEQVAKAIEAAVAPLLAEKAALEKRVAELSAEPAPGKALLKAVAISKEQDTGGASPGNDAAASPQPTTDPFELMKMAQRTPVPIASIRK